MKTPAILMIVHAIAFLLLFVAQVVPGPVANVIVAVGLVVEFPGWFIGFKICKTALPALAFTFFFNAILYYSGGLLIDLGTRRKAQ
ncbi:MAG: hypothetical protein AAB074_09300 [Planctomycetota bacterium]